MNNTVKLTGRKLDSFLSRLSDLVDALPTEETKHRLDRELEALIGFLQDFQMRLRSLPAGEDVEGVTSNIETIKDYVRVAESDPVLSSVLGLSSRNRTMSKSPRAAYTAQNRSDAKGVAEELKGMSSAEIERMLADRKKYNVAMLRQIGDELGLNLPSRSTRLSIIEKIVKKTANLRGYNYLRQGSDEKVNMS
ncbi:MAG: hypothetical protein OXU79_00250 [Gemmatimonadota bacterium]|nr:hypothetical protein [Gemmatimonadota bacterium]